MSFPPSIDHEIRLNPGFGDFLRSSIAESEEDQRRHIAEAVRERGPDPEDWTKYSVGLVAVKVKQIGQERMQLHEWMKNYENDDGLAENEQDVAYRYAADQYGDETVDHWPYKTQIEVARQAKQYWERKGISF